MRRFLAVAVASVVAGCSPNDRIPSNAQLTCPDGTCPTGRVCHNGYCVDPNDIDTTPPDFVAPSPTVTPELGTVGQHFAIDIVSTKPLLAAPTVVLALDTPITLTCTLVDPTHAGCGYDATGQEVIGGAVGGEAYFNVTLVDLSGNTTIRNRAGHFALDFIPPTLAAQSVVPAPPERVRLGAALQIFFTASKALDGGALLRASVPIDYQGSLQTAFTLQPEGETLNYAFDPVITSADTPGPVSFTVSMTDLAGNSATVPLATTPIIDNTLPALANQSVSPAYAKDGTLVAATFDISKALAALPMVTMGGLPMSLDAGSDPDAGQYVYTRTVSATSDAEGIASVVVQATDLAGNALVQSIGTVDVDFTPPSATLVPNQRTAKLGDQVSYTLTASEPLQGVPPLTVQQDGGAGILAFSWVSGTSYVYAYAVNPTDGDGEYDPSVSLTDLAGNTASGLTGTPFALDTTRPTLSSLTTVPPHIGIGEAVTVGFTVSEPSEAFTGTVSATVGPYDAPCAPRGSGVYACAYTMNGTEIGSGTEVIEPVLATAVDPLGNAFAASAPAVVFDAKPPLLVGSPAVAYVPAAGNPLPIVTAATGGTTVLVTVQADEAVDAGAVLTADNGAGVVVAFSPPTYASPTTLQFSLTVDAGWPDGTYVPTLAWSDLYGNAASFPLPSPIAIKTSTPSLTVNQAQVTYVRSPVGSAQPETLDGGFTVPPGPYFALAPGDPLDGSPRLADGTFMLDTGVPPTRVEIWSAASGGQLLGVIVPDADGGVPRDPPLQTLDAVVAWATGIDPAGNVSAPVAIQNTEWVSTSGSGGSEPVAQVTWSPFLDPTLVQDPNLGGPAVGGLDAPDGLSFDATAQGVWRFRGIPQIVPLGRSGAASAYDTARGRLVLFGGDSPVFCVPVDELWEWTGETWVGPLSLSNGPQARSGAAMTYDAARARVVLFGGHDSTRGLTYGDTWEWDGTSWVNRTPDGGGPTPRYFHTMGFDSARGKVVMFGGRDGTGDLTDTTWEWDGAQWSNVTPATGPQPRDFARIAYDPAVAATILFGGVASDAGVFGDTWSWDGTSWTALTPASSPSPRFYQGMAYDPASQKVVLFHGITLGSEVRPGPDCFYPPDAGVDTWAFDGTNWSDLGATGADSTAPNALFYDVHRAAMVATGFTGNNTLTDVELLRGTNWVSRSPATTAPSPRGGMGIDFDTVSGLTTILSGQLDAGNDVWTWNGFSWTGNGSCGGGLNYPAMAFDGTNNVSFGGSDSSQSVTADLVEGAGTGACWPVRTLSSPPARDSHAMAYDSTRKRLVMFGGKTAAGLFGPALSDTWEWDGILPTDGGSGWVYRTDGGPAARYYHTMAYDSARGRTVVFGGAGAGAGNNFPDSVDPYTWEWDGTRWYPILPPVSPLGSPAMAFDSKRGRTVLVDNDPADPAVPVWEWDGTSWTKKMPGSHAAPTSRSGAVYDSVRQRLVMFGGLLPSNVYTNDTWEWDDRISHIPAISFTALFGTQVPAASFEGVRVRAYGGGLSQLSDGGVDPGSNLYGWSSNGASAGSWVLLASNAAAPDAGLASSGLSWSSPTAAAAQQMVLQRDGTMTLQLRPIGISGSSEAQVSADYIEVRVRYAAPP